MTDFFCPKKLGHESWWSSAEKGNVHGEKQPFKVQGQIWHCHVFGDGYSHNLGRVMFLAIMLHGWGGVGGEPMFMFCCTCQHSDFYVVTFWMLRCKIFSGTCIRIWCYVMISSLALPHAQVLIFSFARCNISQISCWYFFYCVIFVSLYG